MSDPVCGKAPAGETNTASDQGVTANRSSSARSPTSASPARRGSTRSCGTPATSSPSWCNSLGGINGRQIKVDKLDAALFNYNQQIVKACGMDFSLVGGGGVFDNTGQKTRLSCLLPDFPAYLVTPEARGADLTVQVTPGPLNSLNFGGARYLAQKFPASVDHVGYLTGNVPTTITNKNQYEEAGKTFGFKTVYDGQYNATGESTWVPIAQAIKRQAGIEGPLLHR